VRVSLPAPNNTNGHLYINFIHKNYFVRTLFHMTRELYSIQDNEERLVTRTKKRKGTDTKEQLQTQAWNNCTLNRVSVSKKHGHFDMVNGLVFA
jgi:hypothetical protein